MSSLLRSSKFLRYFAGAARNLVATSSRINVETGHLQNVPSLSAFIANNYATRAASTPTQYSSNLERSLQQLDQDVRRTGRISRRELEDVLEEIRQSKTATSSQSLLVIRCCGNLVPEELPQVRTKLVQEIWATLEKLKVPMDISHYNALLRVYLENEHEFSPAEFLQELEKKGVDPNRVTYQRLVTRYCQQGDIEGATRILEFMREKSLPVNESVFNALIMGHSQSEDMESAAGILNVMKQAGLEPSADTYTTLLVGHAKRGDIAKIREIFAECDKSDIYLLDKDHLEVAYALAANGHANLVDEILARTRKSSGFNQDAVSTILRLVNIGQEEVGFKILKLMARPARDEGGDSPAFYQGSFLVKQLVRVNRPLDSILSVCQTLESDGMNSKALSIATETALLQGNVELGRHLLKSLKEAGTPIRQHYFWPLICAAGRNRDDDAVAAICKEMNETFGIMVSGETVREYVIPNLSFSDRDHIVGFLKRAGISSGATASSLVFELLQNGKIAEAADVASKYRAFYSPILLRRALNSAFLRSRSVKHYVSIIHHIYEGADRTFQGEEQDSGPLERKDIVGNYLSDLLLISRDKPVDLKPILEGLLERGLAITTEGAEAIQSRLSGERLTNEISELLTKLTAPDLEATKAQRTRIPESAFEYDEPSLRDRILKTEATGAPAGPIKRTLLSLLLKNQEFDKAEQLMQEFGSDAGPGTYAIYIEGYTAAGKLDEAVNALQKMKATNSEAHLDPLKLLRLVEALIKAKRIPDGIRLLEENPTERKFEEVPFVLKSTVFQLLNELAEVGDVANLERAFDIIVNNKYVEVNNVILGPLIKVHVRRDDIPTALKRLEEVAEKYKATPWKSELTKRLIELEDAASLQTLTDISSKVHGEINSLYDLVFSFVECGRIRQARKILETPGLRNRQDRFNLICQHYEQERDVASLEGLAEATRDMTHIDRRHIFDCLLTSYTTADDATKALGVWTQMQEEDIQASDEFLRKLAKFLEEKGLAVPFVKPEVAKVTPPPTATRTKKVETSRGKIGSSISSALIGFRNALKIDNLAEAKSLKEDLEAKNIPIPPYELSILLEAFCRKNQLNDAFNLALEMLKKGDKITDRHFVFLSNRLSTAGDVEKLIELGKLLDRDAKKLISYDNKLCGAYLRAGRGIEYIDVLHKEIESAKSEDVSILEEKFPRGAIAGVVEQHPELIPKFEQIADKYYQLGSSSPANVLWALYFITPDLQTRADQIYDKYELSKTPRLMFARILTKARIANDIELIDKLVIKLKDSTVSESGQGVVYSCAIDILVASNKAEEAMARLNNYIDNVSLENFNASCLQRLKVAIEAKGKPFPFVIPPRRSQRRRSLSQSNFDEEINVEANLNFFTLSVGFTGSALRNQDDSNWKLYLKDYSGVLNRCPLSLDDVLTVSSVSEKSKNASSSSSSSDDEPAESAERK